MAPHTSAPAAIDHRAPGKRPGPRPGLHTAANKAASIVTKYASASGAKVSLSCTGDSLRFTVTDNGTGFDTATTRYGTGLQGMADRLAALGGALQVRSQPGHGTILSGQLPLSHLVTD